MTRLYLVRHGSALSAEVDPEKHLSPEGRAGVLEIGKRIVSHGMPALNKIVHSDKARATETAQLLSEALEQTCGCGEHPGLAPMDDPGALIPELEALTEEWMIVSHLPYLDRLLSQLVTSSDQYRLVQFNPGTTVCLSLEGGHWLIEWVET